MQYYEAAAESWGYYGAVKHNIEMKMISSKEENDDKAAVESIFRLASASAVVIFSSSTCCMCHAVKSLLCGMGVNPTVYELDHNPTIAKRIERALIRLIANNSNSNSNSNSTTSLPVVFIGGKLVGAMDRVMASHITGTLVPLLKEAGALWL